LASAQPWHHGAHAPYHRTHDPDRVRHRQLRYRQKARLWLQSQGLAAEFHDFKKQGLAPEVLAAWVQTLGWERLLNRKGTTWRKLAPAQQASAHDASGASALMLAHHSVIKRPVVRWPDGRLTVGFAPEAFAAMLA